MVVALSKHPRVPSQGARPALIHRPVLVTPRIFRTASSLRGSGEFRKRLLTRHVWLSSRPVSIHLALFEGLLRGLMY